MPLSPRPATFLALASLALATLPATAATASSPTTTPGPRTPVLSATARAHGLTAAYGAVPGWTMRHLAPATHTAASPGMVSAAGTGPTVSISMANTQAAGVAGIDVSSWSGSVNWSSFRQAGVRFTYVKATEGTYYLSGLRASQVAGARRSGMYVGAYHFANPSQSSGTAQADYFINHGGGWRTGTLPGAVDLEWNPYSGGTCYGLTPRRMSAWISAFQQEYHHRTGKWPVIYTARAWWNTCVAGSSTSTVIAARSRLWLSTPGARLGLMPYPWSSQRIWQYAYSSAGYDSDIFNGTRSRLAYMARTGR